MIKLLGVGDGGVATGFARVMHNILGNLPKEDYDIHHIAINYRGDPYDVDYKMYPAMLGGDMYGLGRLDPLIEAVKPDIVFILNDTWMLHKYLEHLKKHEEIKKVVYFPVDAKPLREEWCRTIVDNAVPVAYNDFGKSAILDLIPDAKVYTIPHGVDTETFYPVDREMARMALQGIEPGAWIVLNANRNQPRKRLDLTIKGFAKFAVDKPKSVKLYLHSGIEDMGYHIIKLAERYDIDNRLLLTSLKLSPSSYVTDQRLNWIYNAADLGLNTSMGEGWSFSVFEQGACNRAQVVPDSSALSALYTEEQVRFMPIDHYKTYPRILTEGAVVTPDAVAEALEFYYENSDIMNEHAQNLYDYVTSSKFDWKNIGKQWDEIFRSSLTDGDHISL